MISSKYFFSFHAQQIIESQEKEKGFDKLVDENRKLESDVSKTISFINFCYAYYCCRFYLNGSSK